MRYIVSNAFCRNNSTRNVIYVIRKLNLFIKERRKRLSKKILMTIQKIILILKVKKMILLK